nr:FUSC family protein [Cohnella lubricantis]
MLLTALKMALASGIAWELAKLAGSKHPFLAPVSVILCMQPSVQQTLQFSLYRVAGTVIGVILTVIASIWLPLASWSMALLIVFGCALSLAAERHPTLIREVALSVVLVLELQRQSESYAIDRIRDTFIGVGVALVLHLLVLPPKEQPQSSS